MANDIMSFAIFLAKNSQNMKKSNYLLRIDISKLDYSGRFAT